MAILQDLISQISDPALRDRIAAEAGKLVKSKKFGLVFEAHLPECTPLYDIPVKKGSLVAQKRGYVRDLYTILKIDGKTAFCVHKKTREKKTFDLDEIVSVAEFGEPIYPFLKPIDSVCNAPKSDLWHTLIEADNYHALQLLEYLYAGKVDCIYIDPPYNSGARDWKYNNDYVDGADTYRHSKWLSMMERRLKLAKKLLNPKDSVLIITIDEKEYLHLGCLLEQTFQNVRMQMISSIVNPKGVSGQKGFRRADEYIFFLMFGDATPAKLPLGPEWSPSANKAAYTTSSMTQTPSWTSMMRRGSHSSREERPGLYYAIYADPVRHVITKVGNTLPPNKERDDEIDGLVQIRPIRTNGNLGCWQVGPDELRKRIEQGRVRLGKETKYGFVVNYLSDGEYKKIEDGFFTVTGREEDGSLIATKSDSSTDDLLIAPTQWKLASHDASAHGSTFLSNILGGKKFTFPKSLYAVEDTLRFFVANKPNALIVDFFAGSGTTLHAVNLLNAKDGGYRRCIIVTNNEVSEEEAKKLSEKGRHPGDPEWEKLGIARYVTWPRTVCSIKGEDVNGQPLKGNYLGSDLPMEDGFKANAVYFKLGFLDKTSVALGKQFVELLPILWMKAGAVGKCPSLEVEELPPMLLFPENHFAVLIDEASYSKFVRKMAKKTGIQTIYFVTDSSSAYREMAKEFGGATTYQLYRDYLDNFRINTGH